MPANENWPRWIFASVSTHFREQLDPTQTGLLFIEGQHRATREKKDFFEFRMDGPTLQEVSKGCWVLRIEVNILVQSVMTDTDYHKPHTMVGQAATAFLKSLPVYRFGKNNPPDDQTILGCLRLLQNVASRDFLEINHFGQIDKKTKLVQATVEGHYKMLLQTS